MAQKSIWLFLVLLITTQSCKKENQLPPPQDYSGNTTYTFTVRDAITHQPLDSAYVQFAYGNGWGDSQFTDANGKVSFEIPAGWVLNSVSATHAGFCYYINYINSNYMTAITNINLNPISYIRFHIQNLNSPDNADLIRIHYPDPALLNSPEIFYTGQVNTTNIVASYTGNIGFNYTVWAGANELYTESDQTTTIGRDTVDVYINY